MTERITLAQLHASHTKARDKRRVRGTKRTTVEGITFDSKREAERWMVLLQLLQTLCVG